jgi:hypothetical protein
MGIVMCGPIFVQFLHLQYSLDFFHGHSHLVHYPCAVRAISATVLYVHSVSVFNSKAHVRHKQNNRLLWCRNGRTG